MSTQAKIEKMIKKSEKIMAAGGEILGPEGTSSWTM